jgi:hypothetical protein
MSYIIKLYNNKYVDETTYKSKLESLKINDDNVKKEYLNYKQHAIYMLKNSDNIKCTEFFCNNLNMLDDNELDILKEKVGISDYYYIDNHFMAYTKSCINMCDA